MRESARERAQMLIGGLVHILANRAQCLLQCLQSRGALVVLPAYSLICAFPARLYTFRRHRRHDLIKQAGLCK